MKRLTLIMLLITLSSGVSLSGVYAREHGDWSGEIRVDFINTDTWSVSLPLGSEDGLTAEIFFALLDNDNRVITEIFPFEILSNRFWSGPLSPDVFNRVQIGTKAIRVTLNQIDIQRIQAEYRSRSDSLQGSRASSRREQLLQSYEDLEEAILLASNRKMKIRRDRAALQESLKKERRDLAMRVDRINYRLDQWRNDLDDLDDDKDKLVEERKKLQERQNAPQSRIDRLTREISEIEEEIREVRDEIRELREERRDAELDADRRGISRIRSDLVDLALEEEDFQVELEQLEAQRAIIGREIQDLEVEQGPLER